MDRRRLWRLGGWGWRLREEVRERERTRHEPHRALSYDLEHQMTLSYEYVSVAHQVPIAYTMINSIIINLSQGNNHLAQKSWGDSVVCSRKHFVLYLKHGQEKSSNMNNKVRPTRLPTILHHLNKCRHQPLQAETPKEISTTLSFTLDSNIKYISPIKPAPRKYGHRELYL